MSLPNHRKSGLQVRSLGVLISPDDSACWNPPVAWNIDNPWVVGKCDSDRYDGLSNCFRVCAENDACYKDGWRDEGAASATCKIRGPSQGRKSDYVWWLATTTLQTIEFQGAGGIAEKLHVVAWCE
jgi:hypothetical protein